MIPTKSERSLISSGSGGSVSFGISAKNSAHIMKILRSTLYSDKIMAVLREYSANAWDANRSIGRGDVPIEVQLPTALEPVLRIRDCGPGLSLHEIERIFSQYGESTKRDNDDGVGMLGIGSKSGFAYTDSFTVTSWHGGEKSIYFAVLDPSDVGQLELMSVEPCPVEETGLEICIAVRPEDILTFHVRAATLYRSFSPQPKINLELKVPDEMTRVGSLDWISAANYSSSPQHRWSIQMGCINYPIKAEYLPEEATRLRMYGTVEAPIGAVSFAASREELDYDKRTREFISQSICRLIEAAREQLLEGIDLLDAWNRRLQIIKAASIGFKVPERYSELNTGYVHFTKESGKVRVTLETLGLKGRRWRPFYKKMEDWPGIDVNENSCIIIGDDRRAAKGFEWPGIHVLLCAEEPATADAALLAAVHRLIKEFGLTGIPVKRLSSIPWKKPVGKGTIPVPKDKALARCFVLQDKDVVPHPSVPSEMWAPATRLATDDDVFEIIDGYRPENYTDFFSDYLSDRMLLSTLGITMPQVYGYKTTKARPVSSAKGIKYRLWRKQRMTDLICKDPKMGQLAKLIGFWQSRYDDSLENMHKQSVDALGTDHQLSQFISRFVEARGILAGLPARLDSVVNWLRDSSGLRSATAEYHVMAKGLTGRYPLLPVGNSSSMSNMDFGDKMRHWLHYVKLLDDEAQLATRNVNDDKEAA